MSNIEIERKFLVNRNSFKSEYYKKEKICQGFLSSVPERTVRVRLKGDKAFLTIKGIGNESGTTRFEWEKEISVQDAENLFQLCEPGVINKYRFYIKKGVHTFEVDEFLGKNKGLIIAEVELNNENEKFEIPKWLGKEVTGIVKYYNVNLINKPFTSW